MAEAVERPRSRLLFLLPALVFLIVLTQLPFIVTLGVSFMNWNAYYPQERGFAGFDNYVRVLTDISTRNAIITTVVLTVTVVLVSLLLGLGIALLLDDGGVHLSGHVEPRGRLPISGACGLMARRSVDTAGVYPSWEHQPLGALAHRVVPPGRTRVRIVQIISPHHGAL